MKAEARDSELDKDAVNHILMQVALVHMVLKKESVSCDKPKVRGSVYDEDTKCYVVVLQRNERIIVSFRGPQIPWRNNCNYFKQQPIDWLNLDAIWLEKV